LLLLPSKSWHLKLLGHISKAVGESNIKNWYLQLQYIKQ
jgi:hypothetical protein